MPEKVVFGLTPSSLFPRPRPIPTAILVGSAGVPAVPAAAIPTTLLSSTAPRHVRTALLHRQLIKAASALRIGLVGRGVDLLTRPRGGTEVAISGLVVAVRRSRFGRLLQDRRQGHEVGGLFLASFGGRQSRAGPSFSCLFRLLLMKKKGKCQLYDKT